MGRSELNGLLLVESDWAERARLKRELESNGWSVWAAADVNTAMRIIAEQGHGLAAALIDLQLPGFQSRRLLTELEQLEPAPHCAVMSISLSSIAIESYRQLASAPLLVKPIHASQVEAAFRSRSSTSGAARPVRELAHAPSGK